MLEHVRRIALGAALSAAILVGASPTGQAQGAQPIANGHGAVAGIPAGTTSTTFSLIQLPNGSYAGHGIIRNSLGGWVHFDLTSVVTIGDTVLMAGPITRTFRAPPQFVVGGTFFQAVKDNGNGNGSPAPDELVNAAAPFPLTVQQILALFGPPPPEAYRPLQSGNIQIH